MDNEKNIEIPFGAFNSELDECEYTIPKGYEAEIKDGKVIVRKAESEDEKIIYDAIKEVCNVEDARAFAQHNETVFNVAKRVLEKQGEQKPVKEQIFPKWTDEEEFYIVALEGLVKDRWRKAEQENDDFNVKKMSDLSFFLKTLKKPEWSEKDEKILSDIIVFVSGYAMKEVNKEWVNFLKSLRPQNTWKPSDAQMASITCAVRKMKESACYDSELVSLFNDLKKLK